ncbi:hypothetical protein Tco_0955420 [Tanacetum coccineum]|uniref:Uncharacterized protein n=1 Tax=Tanacetum coccineum TaxID=301880 RepID=A0ABQ5E752_9ASTR
MIGCSEHSKADQQEEEEEVSGGEEGAEAVKGNNSSEIETLPLFPIHGGSQLDFFGVKASDLSSDHSVGAIVENHREEEDQEGNNSSKIETLYLFPIHGGFQHDFFSMKASDLSSDHSVGGVETELTLNNPQLKLILVIDVVDEDDDIIDEEDLIPHDLAYSDDEDLVNLDIDDADVARGHGGDGGGDDRSPPYQIPTGCGWLLRQPRLGETLMPLGEHAAHLANYLGELVRELSLHYPSWRQMPPKRKTEVVAKIGTQFDLCPHLESDCWPQIYAGIQQHLQNIYNGKILNTLFMNDKSKDTAKARQDLKRLGIQSGLWLGQNKNEKCSKP